MKMRILFDLDGTLADTAPDLAMALNLLRQENHKPALDFEFIRPAVSIGAIAMLNLAFSPAEMESSQEQLRNRFLQLYSQNIYCKTRLFPGMESVLDNLDNQNIRWGIVTNKPDWLTRPLLEAMDLSRRCQCIVSGDTLPQRKPSPEPLFHACKLMNCQPEDTIYIGDAITDIQAGVNAGMKTGVARYGYLEAHARPEQWGADVLFSTPLDILDWLRSKF